MNITSSNNFKIKHKTMEKFIPKMYLRQPACTYSTCGPCATNKKNNTKI